MNNNIIIPKYPKTFYWPHSPSLYYYSNVVNANSFVNVDLVITEKIDGGNTLLYKGDVYARSTSEKSTQKWMGMVRKHHAWKLFGMEDMYLYGEDIYGVHSIEYEPIYEDKTFYAFACRQGEYFASFDFVAYFCSKFGIPVVPVLFRGSFNNVIDLNDWIQKSHLESSFLGGEKEGVVIRKSGEFLASDFNNNVCKSVRLNHVQTDEHWSKNWRPCSLK